jgi:fido (protein-threonine AMPylation protein)
MPLALHSTYCSLRVSTEGDLRDWRYGAIQAERLAAAILDLEGFTDVDPQATLGGGDDKKDILGRRDGALWIAAVYFPPTDKRFTDIKAKFRGDCEGVARHDAQGFAFFVNKQLTMGERDELTGLSDVPTELYHLERLRHILDVPRGYGLRLEYLHITMTPEEQVAFVDEQRRAVARQLTALGHAPPSIAVEALERTVAALERTVSSLVPQGVASSVALSTGVYPERLIDAVASWADLDAGDLRLLHREITDDQPWASGGKFRVINTWIGSGARVTFVPPPSDEVPAALEAVLARWRERYAGLASASRSEIVKNLAGLHYGICAVHPFVDGNGRLARAVLDLAALNLLGRTIGPILTADRLKYYESLRAANSGELRPLEHLIAEALDDA